MKLKILLSEAFRAGASPSVNQSIFPYFMGCILWMSIASPFIPFLAYVEMLGGVVFFVIMTSLLTHAEETQYKIPSKSFIIRRSANVILTSLLATLIVIIGLLLFVIPGIIASKQFVYSGVVAASENVGPIQALKESKKLSMVNGYTLLGGTLLFILPLGFLSNPETILGLMPWSLQIGMLGSIGIMVLFNLLYAWFAYIVLNHMILIAYKEAKHCDSINVN